MPFRLIKGTFQPTFGRPDGDSLRFVPDDPDPIFQLKRRGHGPKLNPNNGSIQLRYEAIDTMEKSAGSFADDATASNLELAGTNGGANSAPGYICSNQLGPNGRPIAFVFAGETTEDDGSSVFLSPNDIMKSINMKQFERGHAYPLFYDTLFDDLRERCIEVVLESKAANRGVWTEDATNAGAEWTGDVDTLNRCSRSCGDASISMSTTTRFSIQQNRLPTSKRGLNKPMMSALTSHPRTYSLALTTSLRPPIPK